MGRELWKISIFLLGLVLLLVSFQVFHGEEKVRSLQDWFRSLGGWGPVVFIGLYTLGVVAALPVTLFAFMAGILFGTVLGVLVSNIAVTLGACLAFLIARFFTRGMVDHWVKRNERLRKLDRWTTDQGTWILILNRLFPLLPFNLMNYAFGLTRIPFATYAFWSWLCMIPALVIYVAGADAVHRFLAEGLVPWDLVGVLLAVVAFLGVLGFFLRKKMRIFR